MRREYLHLGPGKSWKTLLHNGVGTSFGVQLARQTDLNRVRSLGYKAGPDGVLGGPPVQPLRLSIPRSSARWKEGSLDECLTKPPVRHTLRTGLPAAASQVAGGAPMKSSVEIASSLELARTEAATSEYGYAYKELMATYVVWGELLEAWNRGGLEMSGEEFEEQCFEYLHRVQVLGMAYEGYAAQCWAVAFNATTSGEAA